MSRYAEDGSINISVVDGSTYTGNSATDGSLYVVLSNGSSYVGATHPCGAWYVTNKSTPSMEVKAPDGSIYVSASPYVDGSIQVTVVSGSLGGGGNEGVPMGLLLALTYSS